MPLQTINIGATANDGTGDTLRIAGDKINDNFTELYNQLGSGGAVSSFVSLTNSGVVYNHTTYETTFAASEHTANNTLTFPTGNYNIVGDSNAETLLNKTLGSPVLTTPQINDTTGDHQYIVAVSELAADRTITLPLLTDNDEITFNDHAATLLNKRLDSADLRTPTITGWISDNTSAPIIRLDPNANAVNHVKINNASTTNIPQIASYSENTPNDSDVGLGIIAQGFGIIDIRSALRYRPYELNTNGAIDPRRALSVFNPSATISVTLADPPEDQIGQVITLMNKGTARVDITPTNFALGATAVLHVQSNALTQCMWDGTNWQIMGNYIYDSAGTGAKVYVTPT